VTLLAPDRSRGHRWFVAVVFVCGMAALVDALRSLAVYPIPPHWILFGVLTLVTGAFPVKVPSLNATLSISETFLFALVMLFGGGPAVVTLAVDGLVISLVRRRRTLSHIAFNLAEPAVSMWVAARVYAALAGVSPLPHAATALTLSDVGLPALALGGVYFLMNSGLNALAMATESGTSPVALWRKYFLWVLLNHFGGASIAVLVAVNTRTMSVTSLLSVVVPLAPLILISYFTFKSSMGRLEDENVHLADLNRLYLRVVETLAMAVDAKDQVTHGHICRVQKLALRLAQALQVTDANGIKAIESAALLHDIGKLAVPEHILNKPGKLTPAESGRMKLHAPLGADMLIAVDFPYPVVPIVRHHHENWDGTGYPDGLQGDAIPIGARILSVVDCYDALRSHRPYRRALSPDQAVDIILERRGTMYDPAVVDAFAAIRTELETQAADGPLPEVIDRFAAAARDTDRLDAERTPLSIELRLHATDTVLRLYDHLSRLNQPASLSDTFEIVTQYLLRLAPAGLVVFFTCDERSEDLSVARASGFGEVLFEGLTIPMGTGVSGWAAANGRSVINADPALDLGDAARTLTPALRSVLSVPLTSDGAVLGSVSLYSIQAQAFTEEQRQAVELICGPVADMLRAASALEESAHLSRGPSMSKTTSLDALLNRDAFWTPTHRRPLGVLYLRTAGDAMAMTHASVAVNQATRIADLIVRLQADELVVLMPDADQAAGRVVIDRIAGSLAGMPAGAASREDVRVGFACGPYDGLSLRDLLDVARRRLDRDGAGPRPVTAEPHAAAAQGGLSWHS
jgi:putative nucleotidyltransferase with HDIG domain